MKIKIDRSFIIYEDDEGKTMWHIDMIKQNKFRYLCEKEKKSFLMVRDFLIINHPESLL